MRIGMVAPLHESVPPRLYGGTERIVHYLTEALVDLGHEVTLFASGDSLTRAELYPACETALRLNPKAKDTVSPHILQLEMLAANADRFDIVHFHTNEIHFPTARRLGKPSVTTLHGRLDVPDILPLYREFRDLAFISISDHQRKPLPFLNWADTIYHGLPRNLLRFNPDPEPYLAFLGRMSREKRPDLAIEIARRAGMKIKIAAKIDKRDTEYFKTIEHLVNEPHVEFIGEISDDKKSAFLGGAQALLFPIEWPEPFGLVVIEALATGTPVIAFKNGSVPELLRSGVTGFIVNNIYEAVQALKRLRDVNRHTCRQEFESRFDAERMARDHVRVYEAAIATHPTAHSQAGMRMLSEPERRPRLARSISQPLRDFCGLGASRDRDTDSQTGRDIWSL